MDAWTAADSGHQTGAVTEPPVRPAGWPTPGVLRWIHPCRVAAGRVERTLPDERRA